MATSHTVPVGTTPTKLHPDLGCAVDVAVLGTGATVYVGGADVTSPSGFPRPPAVPWSYTADAGEAVYAICAAGQTATLTVLTIRSRA